MSRQMLCGRFDLVLRFVRFVGAIFICLLFPLAGHGQGATSQETVPESHGTVNILLANDNGLVAVVDSMLTYKLPDGDAGHSKDATKIFKIDDRTICTMAGLYAFPGALDLRAFVATFPSIVSHYTTTAASASREQPLSFYAKVELLQRVFMDELRTSLEAFLAYNPPFDITNDHVIVLSLAGYDLDGRLRLTEFALKPVFQGASVFFDVSPWKIRDDAPACEKFGQKDTAFTGRSEQSRVIGGGLSCEVVGVPDVANKMLAHPEMYPGLPTLQVYDKAQRAGKNLSTNEMRALALDLEKATAEDEKKNKTEYVGGDAKVAVLSGGRLTEEPPAPPVALPGGDALVYPFPKAPFDGIRVHCTVARPEEGSQALGITSLHSLVQGKVTLDNCAQILDGILFHNSLFSDSILTYLGDGPLLFAHSNVVEGSTLVLGALLNIESPLIRDLVCSFPWKSVERDGDPSPIETHCK
jgi:hypothetical protein